MYVIELALKLSPLPLSVQRKDLKEANALYNSLKEFLRRGDQNLVELTCEQVEDKKISILMSEVLAVQIYEKTAGASGSRRPGFSLGE